MLRLFKGKAQKGQGFKPIGFQYIMEGGDNIVPEGVRQIVCGVNIIYIPRMGLASSLKEPISCCLTFRPV